MTITYELRLLSSQNVYFQYYHAKLTVNHRKNIHLNNNKNPHNICDKIYGERQLFIINNNIRQLFSIYKNTIKP